MKKLNGISIVCIFLLTINMSCQVEPLNHNFVIVDKQVLLREIINSQDFKLFVQKSNFYFEIIDLYEQGNPDLFNGKKFPENLENLLIIEGYVDNLLQIAVKIKEKFNISKEMATDLLSTVPISNVRLDTKSLIWDCNGGCTYNHGTSIQVCADTRLDQLALLALGLISSGGAAAPALLLGGFYIAIDYNLCTYNAGRELDRCRILCSGVSNIGNAQ